MDVADLVQSFATGDTGTFVVTRRTSAGFDVKGRAIDPTEASITITASIQPIEGRDLMRLEEGRRTEEARVIFTATELMTGEEGGTYEADRVAIDGLSWEVQHVEAWRPNRTMTAAYFRCIVQRRVET